MQKIIFILITFLLVACTRTPYETVQIIWKNQTNAIVVKWMWVKWGDRSILTSAHVVRDDTLEYLTEWEIYSVLQRDNLVDRAILIPNNLNRDENYMDSWQMRKTSTGESIFTEVMRSGSLLTLTGIILNPSRSVIGYDNFWRIATLSWIVLTDLELLPWDSGAPIYDAEREVIDVVHVK